MKRSILFIISLALLLVARAEDLDIHSLHQLSNTMEHADFLKMAIRHDSLTRSISVEQWYEELNIVSTDTLNMLLMPTLYDLIANEYYTRRLPSYDSVAGSWLAFHEHDASILPRLYIRLNRLKSTYGNKLLDLYDSLPDSWERGYVLTYQQEYKNKRYYRSVCAYLRSFPNSPFASDILYRKRMCEQIEIDYSYPSLVSTTDSLTISYNNTNAREIVFEVYRLPEKWPKRCSVAKSLVKVDSLRVTTDESLIFELQDQQCKMKPQPFGTYFVYARVPEDTLQTPVDSLPNPRIYYRIFTVSDLRCLLMQEGQMKQPKPWIIVTDVHTGQPLHHVKVKSGKQLARYTNRNGEAKTSKRNTYYRIYRLSLGEDKYHNAELYNENMAAEYHAAIIALPNATIFRPGDTLHIAFIGQQRHKFQTSLMKNKSLHVSISSSQRELIDTILVMNEEAIATMDFPFTNDMRRGYYSIRARMKDYSALADTYVQLEDYRLPSFSIAFDDSCRKMKREHLTPITGKVLRSNGLPLTGVQVRTNICSDTATTDMNGVFRFSLTDSIVAKHGKHNFLSVTAYATSADGELREASLRISLTSEQSSAVDQPLPMLHGVPQDSVLWLPSDSMTISGQEATLRLGVPRTTWVYCVTSSRNKILTRQWQLLTPGMHAFTFTLPDQTDEYLDVRFLTCREDGTFCDRHHHLKGINRTELHIVPVTMRDYLTPDARETWTFRLTDAQGKPLQGHMVLNMTDQALESLHSSLWESPYMPKWELPFTTFRKPNYFSQSQHFLSQVPKTARKVYYQPPMLYEPYRVDSSQMIVIFGQVVDTQGEPIIGACIIEQGTTRGTVTDLEGYFSLAVSPNAMIRCDFIGMVSVSCRSYSNMFIVMEDDQKALSEVVVTGYGSVAGVQNNSIRIRGVGSIKEVETLGVVSDEAKLGVVKEDVGSSLVETSPALRQGDTRLALYLPNLHTDTAGEVHVHFLTPSDNTEWLIQAMAWADNGRFDYFTRTLLARRTLMLRLQMPRFMRQGDALMLPCVISNAADSVRPTHVLFQIRDAVTDSLLATFAEDLSVAPHASETRFFPYTASSAHDIIVRAEVRDANGTSDGEQRRLTVLPIVEPVSECLPFYMHAADSLLTLALPSPVDASNRRVSLMLCNDPLAYIAAQLPSGIDSSAVTITQLIHNYYTLALRNKLAADHPSITAVDISSFRAKLRAYQRTSGAFSWLMDSRSTASYYLTLRVLAMLGELQEADALEPQLSSIKENAVRFIDKEVVRREKAYRKAHHDSLPDYSVFASYAYVRAMFKEHPLFDDAQRIYSAALDSLYAHLNTAELTSWPMLALTFERAGQHDRALSLINGLRRYATVDHDHGMYWNNLPDRYWWYRQADLQASFLLAFSRIDPQTQELDGLRQWLILNNRTTDWGQSSLNAYVTYALINGMPSVQTQENTPLETITLPDTTTRYTVRHTVGTPAWGALMTSFDAPADQLRSFSTKALRIERRFERSDATIATDKPLTKGEKIHVVLTITTDREMDNVVLTDHRAALLEPIGVSAYRWTSDAFYYRDIHNTEERFYIDHLSRGTTVISYECYVTASGTTLAGLASIVSELAPEFTAHTTTDTLHGNQ